MNILALDFGGSSVKYGLVTQDAVILESGQEPAPLASEEAFLDTVGMLLERFRGKTDGIGISLPGNIDPESGTLLGSGVYMPLYGKCVRGLIEERFGIRTAIENDGKCGALSEAWKGSLKDCRDGIVMILGSGIAGGVIKDHKVHSGKGFNAGEFSYSITNPEYTGLMSAATMNVGALGITYKLCKWKNLDFRAQDSVEIQLYLDELLGSQFPVPEGEPLPVKADGRQFFQWVSEGDEDALRAYREFINGLARMVFNAQICYAPERIVIGGGLSLEPRVLPDLETALDQYYKDYGIAGLMKGEVVRSTYGSEANIYGAAYNFLIRCKG